jgi:hypothetical protein
LKVSSAKLEPPLLPASAPAPPHPPHAPPPPPILIELFAPPPPPPCPGFPFGALTAAEDVCQPAAETVPELDAPTPAPFALPFAPLWPSVHVFVPLVPALGVPTAGFEEPSEMSAPLPAAPFPPFEDEPSVQVQLGPAPATAAFVEPPLVATAV